MILAVRANADIFRVVEFKPGLNLVLAHRRDESSRRHTRNGLGKTTLLNIIHFCLGGDGRSIQGSSVEKIQDWEFSIDIKIGTQRLTVSRSVRKPSNVNVEADSEWLDQYVTSEQDHTLSQQQMVFRNLRGQQTVSVDEWQKLLGTVMYALASVDGVVPATSFKSLLGYEVRRDHFEDPFKYRPRQSNKDMQVSNAFVLDLNWKRANDLHELQSRLETISQNRRTKEESGGPTARNGRTTGELEAHRDHLQRLVDKADSDLHQFRVHPHYVQMENEANELTNRIHDLSNHILQLKRLIDFHDMSSREERPADESKVIELYEEAGAVLSTPLVKRLEDVRAFHIQLIENRRDFLRKEVVRLNQELENANEERENLSNRQAELLQLLNTYGAIEEFALIQKRNENYREELEAINELLKQRKQISIESSEIQIELNRLQIAAQKDSAESEAIKRAATCFDSNSESLYETPGKLIVEREIDTGYTFRVDIKRAESAGIKKMKVFCYDLMRAELWSQRETCPGFLIHDSNIFDGVDERQIALALELAERKARECGFQYIVCMNSDTIPYKRFTSGFNIDKFVRLRLTDNEPAGRLLGIEY